MILNGFDALITIDKNIPKQQNISRFPVTLFVLNAPNNKIETLKPYVAKLFNILTTGVKEKIVEIKLNE